MNPRQLVSSLLLVAVFGSVGVFAWQRSQRAAAKPPTDVPAPAVPAPTAPQVADGNAPTPAADAAAEKPAVPAVPAVDAAAKADVVVTYFTTNVRCESCRKIEALSRRAVVEGFPAELASGRVVFRVINTDEPEHAHYVDRYEITNKIVIVSHQQGGKEVEWKGLQDVWLHLDEPDEFLPYVREPIKAYLAGK